MKIYKEGKKAGAKRLAKIRKDITKVYKEGKKAGAKRLVKV